MQGPAALRHEVAQWRREKDRYFAGPGSPLPPSERQRFRGLPYYEFDDRYVFEVEVKADGQERRIEIQRTGGDIVTYDRAGTFRVDLPGGPATLAAYRTAGQDDDLFVPFRDATTAKETYEIGRYLEIVPAGGGRYLVDFNRAYNPFCAYADHFSCPLVPRENHLAVPVLAGEKKPPLS